MPHEKLPSLYVFTVRVIPILFIFSMIFLRSKAKVLLEGRRRGRHNPFVLSKGKYFTETRAVDFYRTKNIIRKFIQFTYLLRLDWNHAVKKLWREKLLIFKKNVTHAGAPKVNFRFQLYHEDKKRTYISALWCVSRSSKTNYDQEGIHQWFHSSTCL